MTVDPIMVSARVIDALQTIASREIDPLEPKVITIGSIHGGTAHNIIPDRVELKGTVRTLNPKTRENMEKTIERIVSGITSAHRANYKFTYIYGYPVLVNDKFVTERVKSAIEELIGKENVVEAKPTMGGEDFAYYLQKIPGTFLLLGVYNEKLGFVHGVHTSKFNINEKILPYGASILAHSALTLLGSV